MHTMTEDELEVSIERLQLKLDELQLGRQADPPAAHWPTGPIARPNEPTIASTYRLLRVKLTALRAALGINREQAHRTIDAIEILLDAIERTFNYFGAADLIIAAENNSES